MTGDRILPDPEWATCAPDDPDCNTSMQPLGDASVLIDYVVNDGVVVVQGAWVDGELVDECEFAVTRVLFWRSAIQCEIDQERAEAWW